MRNNDYICHMFKLLLLCDYTREPERRLLKGLSDFAKTKGGWTYFSVSPAVYNNPNRSQEVIDRIYSTGVDAVFGRWEGITPEIAAGLGIPVVLRTGRQDYPDFPMLSGNYREIGMMGARFFQKQHYRSCAYIGYKGLIWSEERKEGFLEVLMPTGVQVSVCDIEFADPDDFAIKEWLQSLPKPVGIMACNDVVAERIAETSTEIGIRIPEDLALLGVDNDDFLCNISFPSLSSIHLNFEKQGRELGQTLFQMCETGKIWPARIKVEPMEIIERNSTLKHNIQDKYIKRIVEFIDENYTTPFTLEDVLSDIPLSRRAVELRFKKEMAPETMLSYLTGLRIKHMCKLLETTHLPISEIAEMSGFDDVVNVGRTFKKYTGLTPMKYRNSFLSRADDNKNAGDEENGSDDFLESK